MATMKQNLADAGRAVGDAAQAVGETVSNGAKQAMETVKDMTGMNSSPAEGVDVGISGITEHMPVVASCGKTIGKVDAVEGNAIKLTRKDSPDNQHHFIPLSWVSRVDKHVHLNKNSVEAELNWKSSAAGCGCHS
ncbi:MAG: DUF2171 domain-containing protein [Pirellulales bacterium]